MISDIKLRLNSAITYGYIGTNTYSTFSGTFSLADDTDGGESTSITITSNTYGSEYDIILTGDGTSSVNELLPLGYTVEGDGTQIPALSEELNITGGSTENDEFNSVITSCITIAKNKYIIPCIGNTRYAEIVAKQESEYTYNEENIYLAFIYFSIECFLNLIANKEQQTKPTENTSKSKGGVSESTSGRIGKYNAAGYYNFEGLKALKIAGYIRSNTISRDGMESQWRRVPEVEWNGYL